jgi:rubrerythrin
VQWNHSSAWLLSLFAILCCLVTGAANSAYPKTIAALQERYSDEVIAHQKYGAYAEHALADGYPAIAHLFRALAASEAIHARNFARLLRELGQAPRMPEVKFEVSTTRRHLQQAATVEAEEIDTRYPKILEDIERENHEEAIRFITYAWKAERQHRDLILKIKKAASWFFGMLVSRIEGDPTRYYVCQVCGATAMELPTGQCPICGHPPSEYKEVPGFDASQTPRKQEQPFFMDY